MQSVKVMLGNEVRQYSCPDTVKANDIVVIEGQTGFITASALEVGPELPDLYPIAASFNFQAYGRKVAAVHQKLQSRAEFNRKLVERVNTLTPEEIASFFPELAANMPVEPVV